MSRACEREGLGGLRITLRISTMQALYKLTKIASSENPNGDSGIYSLPWVGARMNQG